MCKEKHHRLASASWWCFLLLGGDFLYVLMRAYNTNTISFYRSISEVWTSSCHLLLYTIKVWNA